jgi:hypothetical protein
MTVDSIPFGEIPPRSLLIVRAHDEADITAIRAKLSATIAIFPARRDTDVFCLTEEVLNAAGWYRRMGA